MKKIIITIFSLLLLSATPSYAVDPGCDPSFPNCSSAGDACYAGCGCPSSAGCTENGTYTCVYNGSQSCTCTDAEGNSVTKSCGCYLTSCGGGGSPGGPGGGTTSNIRDEAKGLIAINTNLGDFVSRGASAIILVAALGAFIFLLWGGLDYLMSGGDKEKIEKAKSKITNTFIALAIVAAAWAVYLIIDYFFGIGITG